MNKSESLYAWLPRLLFEGLEEGAIVRLSAHNARHLKVRRVSIGGVFLATDGEGREAMCRLISIRPMTAEIERVYSPSMRELPHSPVLAFALVKDQMLEWAIRSAVEIGVREFQPVVTERSLSRISETKLDRWRKIAVEAMKQCGGIILPRFANPVGLEELGTRQGIFLSPAANKVLTSELSSEKELLLIGPEGGFSPSEEKLLCDRGWCCCSLGPRILRTGTAMVAVSTIVAQGRWREG